MSIDLEHVLDVSTLRIRSVVCPHLLKAEFRCENQPVTKHLVKWMFE